MMIVMMVMTSFPWTVKNQYVKWCLLTVLAVGASAEVWQWPETAENMRINSGVPVARITKADLLPKPTESRFHLEEVPAGHAPFKQPTDTEGFYNRPPGDGRYRMRVQHSNSDRQLQHQMEAHDRRMGERQLTPDGTLDSLQYCKCVSTPNCNHRMDSNACGANQYLCCYKRNPTQYPTSELFNEINDDRLTMYPARPNHYGPFMPPPQVTGNGPSGAKPAHDNTLLIATGNRPGPSTGPKKQILVGPRGPTGIIGPNKPIFDGPEGHAGIINPNQQILVGPGGATGIIGPNKPIFEGPEGHASIINPNQPILVGPGGATGIIGPNKPIFEGPEGHASIINPNQPILVGPGGATGIIGPTNEKRKKNYLSETPDLGATESAQRGVLVGPGGPTGIIGPNYNNRPVLVGPGGLTGIIGPRRQYPTYRGGILVGPGGPTGSIGPRRNILAGPGGQTGLLGPWGYGK